MKAIVITSFGAPEVLQLREVDDPVPAKGEVLIEVKATAVNRADVLQRLGRYPAPKDVPQDIPGLEFAGRVAAVGAGVSEWKTGDRVFGLTAGGSYAQKLVIHSRCVARIPDNLSFEEAAAIPEAFITAYDAMVTQCQLAAGETVLISAVGSGVGTAAVQIAAAIGARSIGTARSKGKLDRARKLGMDEGIEASQAAFAPAVVSATNGDGVDVVLELVGGPYLSEDLQCIKRRGRIIVVGLTAGARAELDLSAILYKRVRLFGTSLRARPIEEKIAAAQLLANNMAPLFQSGKLKPVVDQCLPLAEAARAHAMMENNENFGKLVLVT